jgi:hypothetical protein
MVFCQLLILSGMLVGQASAGKNVVSRSNEGVTCR